MTNSINDGGPAFPSPFTTGKDGEFYIPSMCDGSPTGMTLRDYFAAAALEVCRNKISEIFTNNMVPPEFETDEKEKVWRQKTLDAIGSTVWAVADAVLKARSK